MVATGPRWPGISRRKRIRNFGRGRSRTGDRFVRVFAYSRGIRTVRTLSAISKDDCVRKLAIVERKSYSNIIIRSTVVMRLYRHCRLISFIVVTSIPMNVINADTVSSVPESSQIMPTAISPLNRRVTLSPALK